MRIDQRTHGTDVVLVVHGSLSRQDVGDVEAAIAALDADRVTIDVGDARCDDAAIALLGRDAHHAARVRIVGLSAHQDRVLRYMGLRQRG